MAQLRPDGAVEALLEYLPFAENDKVAAEVQAALVTLAPRNGKPAAALVKVGDPDRRAAPPPPLPFAASAASSNTPPFDPFSKTPNRPFAFVRHWPLPTPTTPTPFR